jgi:toxin ParE1/3/4
MAEIVFRRQAWRDLARIDARIASEDPAAALRFRENVLRRIALLERLPEAAQPRPEFGPNIRTIPIGRYIVILRVEFPKVTVLRIVHSARDLPRLLRPRS